MKTNYIILRIHVKENFQIWPHLKERTNKDFASQPSPPKTFSKVRAELIYDCTFAWRPGEDLF